MILKLAVLCILVFSQVLGAAIFSEDKTLNPSFVNGMDLENIASKVHFYLYTREYNEDYELVLDDLSSLQNSTFHKDRPTKVAIHGYNHDYTSEACQLIRQAYLNSSQDVNVICVDWGKLCREPPYGLYVEAMWHVPKVAKLLAQLIDFLVESGSADITSFHLIGHSLGAHLAADAANGVTSGNITRISGLDPALPFYNFLPVSEKLDTSDANFVDVIHTCGGIYGYYDPVGHIDFYPNGGKPVQPGCGLDLDRSCSHAAVVRYFASSILYPFLAKKCDAFSHVESAECNGSLGYLGDRAPETPYDGIYYLTTSGSYPYTLDVDEN